jgi:hypothetical protein
MKAAKRLVVACLLFAWQFSPTLAASADPGYPPPETAVLGNDISWPQCGGDLPAPPRFAVIGVNGGRPNSTNPCLAAQLAWAAGTSDAAAGTPVGLYVNTANPGPGGSWWWPASNSHEGAEVTNPYGMCDGTATAACAYIYGYAMAFDDVNVRGVTDAAHHMWWLDVETGNSWSPDRAANAADLEGMTAYLQSIGAEVGIYATTYQFEEIAGTVDPGSNLYMLMNWIPGATSSASAQANCSSAPLTAGATIALAQFTDDSLDYNYACPILRPKSQTPEPAQAPEPAQSPPTAYALRHIT